MAEDNENKLVTLGHLKALGERVDEELDEQRAEMANKVSVAVDATQHTLIFTTT